MRKYFYSIGLVILLLNSCASAPSFVYDAGPKIIENSVENDLYVGVLPFKDLREESNYNLGTLYLIPFMPFGLINYTKPEEGKGFLYHDNYRFLPTEDFAHALVSELKENELFKEVFFTYRDNEPSVDLYIYGELKNTDYNGKMFTYGLSVYGPILWIVGLPAGKTENRVVLTINILRAKDKEKLWSYDIEGEWSKISGIYYNWGKEFDGYSEILKAGLTDLIIELNRDLTEQSLVLNQ